MQLLYLSYANSENNPLPTLREEDDGVYTVLSRREADRHFRLHRDSFATIPKIAQYLTLYQDDIVLFHFGGHAGRDRLLLDDADANAAGLAQLLARCRNLKLVILNGCSTREQAGALIKAGVPVVIATSAPVGDRAATQFSITFFQALGDRHSTIGQAFADAIAAAETQSSRVLNVEKGRDVSGFVDTRAEKDEPLWGLYWKHDSDLDWKLPVAVYAPPAEYTPNEKLVERLMEALAPHDEAVRKIIEQEDLGIESSAGGKKKAILACLPHPVSQQLRKLMSKEKGMEDHIFYDKPGIDRLRQIGHTYSTLIELLSLILLADLWQALENNAELNLKAAEQSSILSFLIRPNSKKAPFDFVPLIRSIRLIMECNDLPFFMEELPEISKNFNSDTPFAAACLFLGALRQRLTDEGALTDAEAVQLCPTAENKLAAVLGELGFMAAYSLASVRNINVLKYRYPAEPLFNHKVTRLSQEFMELEELPEVLDNFMDAASVLLQRKKGDTTAFLNLSPFVIDESAFNEKAELAKIFFFERYDREMRAECYRHVYKPGDLPLVVKEQKHFIRLRVQFDAFARSIFQKNLQDL